MLTKNIKFLNFFLFKYYILKNFYSHKNFLFYYKNLNLLSSLLKNTFLNKQKILIIENFTKSSFLQTSNSLVFPDFKKISNYLMFFFKKSKLKTFGYKYFKYFLYKNSISLLFFLDEAFFFQNRVFFCSLKVLRFSFFNSSNVYASTDYNFIISKINFNIKYILYYIIYSYVKIVRCSKLKNIIHLY